MLSNNHSSTKKFLEKVLATFQVGNLENVTIIVGSYSLLTKSGN